MSCCWASGTSPAGASSAGMRAGEAGQRLLRQSAALPLGQSAADEPVMAQEDIVEHAARGRQQHFLEYGGEAQPAGGRGAGQVDRLAVQSDRATVGLDDAGEELHQRALARAVLAQDGVDVPGRQRDVDAVQGHGLAVALAHPLEHQHRGPGHPP